MNRTRALIIVAVVAAFLSTLVYILNRREERAPSDQVTQQVPRSVADASITHREVAGEEPALATPLVAQSEEAAESPASPVPAVPADALEAIRTEEVESFLTLLREGGPTALQMRYWDEWLKVVLEDERARAAFANWVFDRASTMPDDYRTLMAALDSIKRVSPDFYTSMAERAIAEGNAPVLAAAVHHLPTEGREPEWIENLLTQTLSSGDPVARYYAASALNEKCGLAPEVRAQLLREVVSGNGSDPGAEQQAFWQMDDLLTEEDYDLFESQFTQSSDPTVRYFALHRLISATVGSLGTEYNSSRDAAALDTWANIIDFTRDGLSDPDPLVRFAFAVRYLQSRESIQTDIAVLTQLARTGVSIREYAEQH